MSSALPLLLLSTPRLTVPGLFRYRPVSAARAKAAFHQAPMIVNSIRHTGTRLLLEAELGVVIGSEAVDLTGHEVGQRALVVHVHARQLPGAELTLEQIRDEGYTLCLLTRVE